MDQNAVSAAMRSHLLASESVLWSGRPGQGWLLTAQDIVVIPSSLFWGGMAMFAFGFNMTRGAPAAFVLMAVPFLLVGLHLFVGRFVRLMRRDDAA